MTLFDPACPGNTTYGSGDIIYYSDDITYCSRVIIYCSGDRRCGDNKYGCAKADEAKYVITIYGDTKRGNAR